MRRIAVIGAVLTVVVLGVVRGASAFTQPYPSSGLLSGISFDESSKVRYASGSDIWTSTWTSDGNLYSIWGDGKGFSGSTKVELGGAKFTGSPQNGTFAGTDEYYGTPNADPCGTYSTLGGKPADLIGLPGGVIWMFYWNQDDCSASYPSPTLLAESTNNGTSWTKISGLSWPDSDDMVPATFLKFGEAYTDSLDGDLYMYMYKASDTSLKHAYLAKVAPSSISSPSSYQWYTGTDGSGNPVWGSESDAVAVFTNNDGQVYLLVTFDPGIGRYIASTNFGDGYERELGLFDAPTPWGPWTTFDYQTDFDNTGCGSNCVGNGVSLSLEFPQKWMTTTGQGLWGTYSSDSPGYDSLNLIKGNITLDSVAAVKSISVDTGTPAVTDIVSTSNPGNLEYIDRTYRLTSGLSPYVGDEEIRLANDDKSNSDSNYLSFILRSNQNVCVAFVNGVTVPSWLSSWTDTGNSLTSSDGSTFTVYKQTFTSGSTVTLGGAQNGTKNYIVFVGC